MPLHQPDRAARFDLRRIATAPSRTDRPTRLRWKRLVYTLTTFRKLPPSLDDVCLLCTEIESRSKRNAPYSVITLVICWLAHIGTNWCCRKTCAPLSRCVRWRTETSPKDVYR